MKRFTILFFILTLNVGLAGCENITAALGGSGGNRSTPTGGGSVGVKF